MAKLINMFLILIAIQACLILYAAPMTAPTGGNAVWNFVININNWSSISFLLGLIGIAGGIGLIGIAAGTAFGFKTDFLIFAGAIAGFISMGSIFVNLGNVLRDDLIARVFVGDSCTLASCAPVTFIIAITIAPVAFFYAWTVIEWWRGKDY